MRAHKAKTQIRQGQIARAALRLLAVRGWRRVSLAAIAREVGVVPSAVYRHFSGKDQVLDAVLDLVSESFKTNLEAARKCTTNPIACLHEVLMRHVDLIAGGVPIPRIILSEDVFAESVRRRNHVREIYRNYLGEISSIVREGQRAGSIRGELIPDTISLMWLGLVQSPAILWLLSHGEFDLREHCERAWKLFAATLQPPTKGHSK